MVECPAAQHDVERRALERAQRGGPRYPLPEILQRGARAFGAVRGIAVDQHRGIHRARRGPGDPLDAQPRLLEQAVEHAPGERAVRAAALQREVDENRRMFRCRCARRHLGPPIR